MLLDGGRAQEAIAAAGGRWPMPPRPPNAATLILQAAAMRIVDRADGALAALAEAEPPRGAGSDLAPASSARRLIRPRRSADCLSEHEAALARTAGSVEAEANALSGLGDAGYVSRRMRTANGRSRLRGTAHSHGLGRIEVANKHMLGLTLQYLGRFDEALAVGEDAVAITNRYRRSAHQSRRRQTIAYTQGWLMGGWPANEHLDRAAGGGRSARRASRRKTWCSAPC